MKRYPKYKASMIDWIGEVPELWEYHRIKFCLKNSIGGIWGDDEKGDQNDIICLRVADFDYDRGILKESEFTIRNVGKSYLKKRRVNQGDLLLEKSGGGDHSPVGRVIRSNIIITATCSNFINLLKVNSKIDSAFLCYYFKHLYSGNINILYFNQTTGIQNLKVSDYLGLAIMLPIIDEQLQIVSFLDRQTAEIDRVITTREKQIELLDELRVSVISKAMTKGFDPNVKMKPSGVEWIGDVPKSWEYHRIKFCLKNSIGGIWGDDEKGDQNDIICLRVADFDYDKGILKESEYTIRNVAKSYLYKRLVKQGDLLLEKSGGGDNSPVGRVIMSNIINPATCSNFINLLKVNSKIDSKFLNYYFKHLYSGKVNNLYFNQTTGIQNLKVSDYLGLAIMLPAIEEQIKIVFFLDRQLLDIDSAVEKYNQQIELLKSYKTSLISEVVTGKVDVRELTNN